MKKYCFFFLIIFFLLQTKTIKAQFGIPAEVCPSETFNLTNPGSDPINQWDFCVDDLSQTPSALVLTSTIPNAARSEGGTVVTDGTNWYMFIANRNTNNIIRADFGDDLDNNPTYTNLGNISSVLSDPLDIEVIKSGGNWYALVAGHNSDTMYRINFGSNLNNNSPTAEALSIGGVYRPLWFDLQKDGSDFIAIIPLNNFGGSNTLAMIRFQNGMDDASPTIITTSAINNNIIGVSTIKDGSNWYGTLLAADGRTYYLDYGTNLYTTPTITDISSNILGSISNAYDVEMVKDGKNYIALIQSPSPQSTFKLDFGNTMSNQSPAYTNFGNVDGRYSFSVSNATPANTFLTVAKQDSKWRIFVINRNTTTGFSNSLVRVSFPDNCNASQATSNVLNPINISYVLPATYTIELNTYDNDLNLSNSYTQDIIVKASTIGRFTYTDQCFGQTASFTNTSIGSDANVSSWSWDFGDTGSSSLKNPTHTYASTGTYTVTLTVNNISGCANIYTQDIDIVDLTADFELASGGCPGSPTKFRSTSNISPTTLPITYRWLLQNGDQISFLQEPEFTYPEGTYEIGLTLIVGDIASSCLSSITKNINFANPPMADFTFAEQTYVGQAIQFADQSSVAGGATISNWEWSFGGLGTSTEKNPQFTFDKEGEFTVALRVGTNSGCQSEFITKTIQVVTTEGVVTSLNTPEENINKLIIKNLYPNPTSDFVNIEYATPSLSIPIQFYLVDMNGKIVEKQIFSSEDLGGQVLKYQFSKNHKGYYIIHLQQGMMQSSKKILIH